MFDAWNWPVVLLWTFGLFLLLLFFCAWSIRRVALQARTETLAIYRSRQLRYTASPRRQRQIKLIIEELDELRGGAFAPLSQHPVLRAAVLPFLAAATNLMLEVVTRAQVPMF